MAQSPSDITGTSPAPFSPFSTYSSPLGSELATSDDAPDLGAFTNVFRELELHQPSVAVPIRDMTHPTLTPASSVLVTPSDESDTRELERPLASYLSPTLQVDDTTSDHSPSDIDYDSSDTEGEAAEVDIADERSHSDPGFDTASVAGTGLGIDGDDQPSLGYLDGALSFLAEEAAKHAARRAAASTNAAHPPTSPTSDALWPPTLDPRRKRRRKKVKKSIVQSADAADTIVSPIDRETDESSSSLDPSSSFDVSSSSYNKRRQALALIKSTPATPSRNRKERRKLLQQQELTDAASLRPKLTHSKSTPALRLNVSIPLDARILRLRALAHKLRMFFSEDAKYLSRILANDSPDEGDFVDPRGPRPAGKDPLIHCFVDHSNILFGLLTFIKRRVNPSSLKKKHISHGALALILERGRPITRRCIVASSPLYQPMDTAEQLGYEVRVYARVPDTGEGADRVRRRGESADLTPRGKAEHSKRTSADFATGGGHTRSVSLKGSPARRAHAHKVSSGGGSSESDHGSGGQGSTGTGTSGVRRPGLLVKPRRQSMSTALPALGQSLPNVTTLGSMHARVKYREQGVDELLQLKLHQAIAESDPPPAGATIVLATGDGNVGEFSEEGFIGPVRTALRKGWKVELYAWEDGLSQAWMREFGEYAQAKGGGKPQFRVVGLQQFAPDLLDV